MRKIRAAGLATALAAVLVMVASGCAGDDERSSRAAALREEVPGLIAKMAMGGNQFFVRSLSWGVENQGGGTPQPQALNVVRGLDPNSPSHFRRSAEGFTFPTVTLDLLQQDGTNVGSYEFTNAVISSVQNSVGDDGEALEALTLRYEKLEFTFDSASACFDFSTNRVC